MTIEVHGMTLSAPCRIVYLACEALGLEYKMVECDLMKGENKTPEYLKVQIICNNLIKKCKIIPSSPVCF